MIFVSPKFSVYVVIFYSGDSDCRRTTDLSLIKSGVGDLVKVLRLLFGLL